MNGETCPWGSNLVILREDNIGGMRYNCLGIFYFVGDWSAGFRYCAVVLVPLWMFQLGQQKSSPGLSSNSCS